MADVFEGLGKSHGSGPFLVGVRVSGGKVDGGRLVDVDERVAFVAPEFETGFVGFETGAEEVVTDMDGMRKL